VELRLAKVELVSGAVAIAIGALGLREVWEAGRGGPAPALWLFVSVLLVGLGVGAVFAALVLRRGGAGRWSGQVLLVAAPAAALVLAEWLVP
jgi:hypothetical protein